MTEEAKLFVEESVKKSQAWYDKHLNDPEFISKRVQQMTDMTTRLARKSAELMQSGKPMPEVSKLKEAALNEELELQLELMKDMLNDNIEDRRERLKTLSSFDLEDFREANFELVRHEVKMLAHFNEVIMDKAEDSIYKALDALDDEMSILYKNEHRPVILPPNGDELVN